MAFCYNNMEEIDRNECVGNSLPKINDNFLTLDNKLCELSGFYLGQVSVSAINVGATGAPVYKENTSNPLQFRKITGGTGNVSVDQDGDLVKISVTDLTVVSAVNVGTGTGEILKDSVTTPLTFRKLANGSNVTIQTVGDNVVISSNATAASGLNVGTGAGKVYTTNSGNSLQFKTIKAGSNVTVTDNLNDITINAAAGGGALISDTPPPTTNQGQLWFDSSSGVTSVYYGSSWVDVGGGDSTGGTGEGEANTASNLGSSSDGAGLFTSKSGVDLPFKRIKAGSNVSISEGTNSITINAAGGGAGGGVTSVAGTYPIQVANGTTTPNVSIANATSSSAGAMSAADKAKLDGLGGAPTYQFTGAILYFASPSAPTGWLECNGATIPNSGSTASLYSFLAGAGWPFGGVGKIPDLRGKFIRSNGTDGTYSSGTFGATQADLIKNHTHSGTTYGQNVGHTHEYDRNVSNNDNSGSNNNGCFEVNSTGANQGTNAGTFGTSNDHAHGFLTGHPDSGLGGTETRPANVALLACIKL